MAKQSKPIPPMDLGRQIGSNFKAMMELPLELPVLANQHKMPQQTQEQCALNMKHTFLGKETIMIQDTSSN